MCFILYVNFSCFNNDVIGCSCFFKISKWRKMSKITRITFILPVYIMREREKDSCEKTQTCTCMLEFQVIMKETLNPSEFHDLCI